MRTERCVVVGDDGSPSAHTAARWATLSVADPGDTVRLVQAVNVPVMAGIGWRSEAVWEATRLLEVLRQAAQEDGERRVAELASLRPEVHVEALVVTGDPREALVRESDLADVVVVGSRGHGPVEALLLGSVSAYVMRHAALPHGRLPRAPGRGPRRRRVGPA